MNPIIFLLNSDLKRKSLFFFRCIVTLTSFITVYFNYAPPPKRISTKKERSNAIPDLFFLVILICVWLPSISIILKEQFQIVHTNSSRF